MGWIIISSILVIILILTGLYLKYIRGKAQYQLLWIIFTLSMTHFKKYWSQPPANICKLTHNNQILLITYRRGTEVHKLRIPYSRQLAAEQASRQVKVTAYYLRPGSGLDNSISNSNSNFNYRSEDMTQQPGTPYFITARLLGAEYLTVTDKTGSEISRVSGHELLDPTLFE